MPPCNLLKLTNAGIEVVIRLHLIYSKCAILVARLLLDRKCGPSETTSQSLTVPHRSGVIRYSGLSQKGNGVLGLVSKHKRAFETFCGVRSILVRRHDDVETRTGPRRYSRLGSGMVKVMLFHVRLLLSRTRPRQRPRANSNFLFQLRNILDREDISVIRHTAALHNIWSTTWTLNATTKKDSPAGNRTRS